MHVYIQYSVPIFIYAVFNTLKTVFLNPNKTLRGLNFSDLLSAELSQELV